MTREQKQKLLILGTGITFDRLTVWAFDDLLYPNVFKWSESYFASFQIIWASVIMTYASLVVCLLFLVYYDKHKTDWLGIEWYKESVAVSEKTARGKLMRKVRFVMLSIVEDPFITTAYMREGAHQYDGMKKSDWKVFFFSLLVGNASWSFITHSALSRLEGEISKVIVVLTFITLVMPFLPKIVGLASKFVSQLTKGLHY